MQVLLSIPATGDSGLELFSLLSSVSTAEGETVLTTIGVDGDGEEEEEEGGEDHQVHHIWLSIVAAYCFFFVTQE